MWEESNASVESIQSSASDETLVASKTREEKNTEANPKCEPMEDIRPSTSDGTPPLVVSENLPSTVMSSAKDRPGSGHRKPVQLTEITLYRRRSSRHRNNALLKAATAYAASLKSKPPRGKASTSAENGHHELEAREVEEVLKAPPPHLPVNALEVEVKREEEMTSVAPSATAGLDEFLASIPEALQQSTTFQKMLEKALDQAIERASERSVYLPSRLSSR